ncbi:MAG: DUF3857 domain-containing protein [Bacteroidota bacterium]
MHKSSLLGVSILLMGIMLSPAFSQPSSTKFGKVDDDLVKMKTYEADPDAEAVVAYDYGQAFIPVSGSKWIVEYTFHRRVKILSEAGFSYGDFEIPYYAEKGKESVFKIKGITHVEDENGKVTKIPLEKKDIYREDLDGNYKQVKFSMPQVTVGSVVEISYTMNSEFIYNIDRWYFQESIPVMYSEYKTKIPDWFNYRASSMGYLGLTDKIDKTYSENVSRSTITRHSGTYVTSHTTSSSNTQVQGNEVSYIMKDVPAFISEKYSTTPKDYLSSIAFQLQTIMFPNSPIESVTSSWEKLAEELSNSEAFGRVVKPLGTYKNQLKELDLADKSDIEKAAIVFNSLRSNILWNEKYGIYLSSTIGEVFKNKEGNSGEMNLILTGMLNAAGLEAYPVLISTRGHGILRKGYPILSQFNHVITMVKVGEGWATLDAVSRWLDFGILPVSDLNRYGLLVTNESSEWIDIKPLANYNHKGIVMASIEGDQLKLDFRSHDRGYTGTRCRVLYSDKKEDNSDFIKAYMKDEFSEMEVDTAWVKEYSSEKGFVSGGEILTSDFINKAGDFIYIQPMMNEGIEENPFKLEKRLYPVDIAAPIEESYTLVLNIPEGYEVAELPKPTKVVTPDKSASFMYQAANMGKVIQLQAIFKIDKTLFLPEEYAGIKGFYDYVVKKHAEQIVLKRKT